MCGDENTAPADADLGGHRGELLVVANRLPVHQTDGGWETSPGGLVSALMPLLQQRQGVWIGWGGSASGDMAPFRHDGLCNVPVTLSADEVRDYYHCAHDNDHHGGHGGAHNHDNRGHDNDNDDHRMRK